MVEGLVLPTGQWVHWASSFVGGDKMIGYVNGRYVGEMPVAAGDIVSNNDPFIIGIAPWDLVSFQTWGQIDEIAVWNVARTEEQIRESMHRRLDGTETGLIAYYDFDDATGNTLTDHGPNGLHGTLMNFDDDWEDSRAVIANSTASGTTDLNAIWNGLNENPSFAITDNGLSLTSFISVYDYALWGHNEGSGNSTANAPANAPASFERLDREWYVNEVGEVIADMTFNVANAVDGGTSIDLSQPAANYTLLWRANTSDDYTVVAAANTWNNTVVVFNGVQLENGYYTLGVADEQMGIPSGLEDVANTARMLAFPNPTAGQLSIQLNSLDGGRLELLDAMGRVVWNERVQAGEQVKQVHLGDVAKGAYVLRGVAGDVLLTQVIVVE